MVVALWRSRTLLILAVLFIVTGHFAEGIPSLFYDTVPQPKLPIAGKRQIRLKALTIFGCETWKMSK